MLRPALLILALSATSLAAQDQPPRKTIVRDSTGRDTTGRVAIRKAVTPELLASAYEDTLSRALLARARANRLRQDSSIASYEAHAFHRMTVKAAVGGVSLEKL